MKSDAEGRLRNVLLITTDQERYFDSDPAPLPAHERLRSLGTSYDRFYAASVACSSARSVIYTGLHAPSSGVIDNIDLPTQADLDPAIPTIGSRLRDLGYVTAHKGKWHLSMGPGRSSRNKTCAGRSSPTASRHLGALRPRSRPRRACQPVRGPRYNRLGPDC